MTSWTVVTVLLMLGVLDISCEDIGCKYWDDVGNNEICCKECHTGNRRVSKCGLDPKTLCTPCQTDYYTPTESSWHCDRCNQCVYPQVVRKPCSGTTDTLCGCAKGYRCHTPQCEQCEKECGPGQEPVGDGTCRVCPHGTFNDKVHQPCRPWTRCPPGFFLITNGTASSDGKCEMSNEIPLVTRKQRTTVYDPPIEQTKKNPGDNDQSIWICMGFLGFCLLFIVIIVALFSHQIKINKLPKTPHLEFKTPEPMSLMTVEQEECSFCQPQQEQGSSMESLSTQDSVEKLLPPV